MPEESGKKSFEEALARLEEIVTRLETGDLTLEESMTLFEEGVGLARLCQEILAAAEGRLEMLTAEGVVPFPATEERGPDRDSSAALA
ncbi:MAG: exodeoxyribonuclease VII small subunit [Firmicutes bacterium]|nr:exodeoxyribonuclease VII small subunit [Bacillota bacterium]